MTDFTIRKVTDVAADKRLIERMHKVCFPTSSAYDPLTEGSHWWLAKALNGAPVGFGGLTISTKEGGGYLCRGGVLPVARGNGLQRGLIKARIKFAKDADLNFLVTDTVEGNYPSANNLIECGFRLFNPITPWGNEGNLYWRLELE